MPSLQARLALGLAATVAGLFVLQWVLTGAQLRALTEQYVVDRLRHDIESLLVAVRFDPQGRPVLDEERVNPVFQRPFSGHYYRIMAAGRVLRSRSLWDRDLLVSELPPGDSTVTRADGPEGQNLVVVVSGFRKRGHDVTIAVAEDYSPIDRAFETFQWRWLLVSSLVVLALIAAQMWVVRRGLQPLERLREDIRRLERGELSAIRREVPAEVQPLVDELNRLLEVLGRRLSRTRNALGNLAHALKTPLTVLGQALNDPALADRPGLRAELERQVQAIASLVHRELKRARLAGAGAPGQRFDVDRELTPLVHTLERIHHHKAGGRGLVVEILGAEGVVLRADREDMLELLGNLLDNACKWARSRARLTVRTGEEGVSFVVEDDGPGVSEDDLARLAQRGVRLDESVGGHGLGLSIVKEVVEQYEGRMRFGRSPSLGGFLVEVSFPPTILRS